MTTALLAALAAWVAAGADALKADARAADAGASLAIEAGASSDLGRRLCGVTGDDRVLVAGGRLVAPDAPNARAVLSAGDCAAPSRLALYVVPAVPRGGTTARLFVDEGRLELKGGSLAGATVWWRFGSQVWTADSCGDVEPCSVNVPVDLARTALSRAPLEVLRLPPGFPPPSGSAAPELWPRAGRGPVSVDDLRAPVQRTILDAPVVRASSVEAWRERAVLPLALPDIAASVSCRPASCWVADDGASIIVVPPAAGDAVTVNARLRTGFAVQQADGLATTASVVLPVARCQMRPLSSAVLAGTEDHLLPVALGERCPSDLSDLAAETSPPSAAFIERFASESKRADVRLGHVPRGIDSLELRLVRASTRAIVGSVRLDVRARYAPLQVSLVDSAVGELGVIPTNRDVRIEWASPDRRVAPDITPISLPGFYAVRHEGGATYIRGQTRTVGEIPLVFAYRPLDSLLAEPLATFESDVHFAVRPVNVPVSLSTDDARTGKLFAMLCRNPQGAEQEIKAGVLNSLPYASRGSCRLRIARDALSPEDGAQRIRVTVSITSPAGGARDGGFSRVLVLSSAANTDALWVGEGASMQPYDHVVVQIAHDDEPGFYVAGGGTSGLPSRRYQMVFGNGRVRLYGSAAVPTGLYRIVPGGGAGSGVLQFNAGVVARLAFLDREGHEFPLDLEIGLLGTDLSGKAALSMVLGPGITVPLINAQQAAQAAIGIHAWLEWAPGRAGSGEKSLAFIFGPSISFGDFGTNL
jgi:hypothetical protein